MGPKWLESLKSFLNGFSIAEEGRDKTILFGGLSFLGHLIKKGTIVYLILGLVLGAAVLFAVGMPLPKEHVSEENVYVTVREGMDAGSVLEELKARGIVESSLPFWWEVKLGGLEDKFKTGTYLFHPGMDTSEVVAMLVNGETTAITFTIPEGFGVKEIAERLEGEGLVEKGEIAEAAKDFYPYSYVEHRADTRYAAEGFLFPDTYTIDADMSAKEILAMMARDFDERLTPAMREKAQAMNLSIYDLVTLASLVEKEARYAEDRPMIAQVFLKRLELGMPLQSDTTLQYLLDAPKEDVSLEDTEIDSPYNTYQHMGLPPGPIASPGLASIEAVLNPSPTDYVYFVADRSGHNHYSHTYEEHLAIVNEVR